ncbi:MAG TPA: hypothetical protein VNU64_22140 [Burkholderiales bacterium]|nr:hypothetical protein [Burkholderiales bacterium]
MMILRRLVIACAAAGCATAAAADDRTALYSFNDLYRLTVSGAVPELPRTELREVRVAQAEPVAAPTEFTFTITPVPGPGRWPLVLAGLAAAAWVAHRRLTRPL